MSLSGLSLENLFGEAWRPAARWFLGTIGDNSGTREARLLLERIARFSTEEVLNLFHVRGWELTVTEDLMEKWMKLAKENNDVGQPIARSLIYMYTQNYIGLCEEMIVTYTRLGNAEQKDFLEVIEGLVEGERKEGVDSADGLLFKGLRNFLEYPGATNDVDTPLTLLDFLQGDGMELIKKVIDGANLARWTENRKLNEKAVDLSEEEEQNLADSVRNAFNYFRNHDQLFLKGGPTISYLHNPASDYNAQYATVNFTFYLENQTGFDLRLHQKQVVQGWVKTVIVTAKANETQRMEGRHLSATATGCVGSIAWSIGDTGKILVVMYSVPYDKNLYSNWLSVGIFDATQKSRNYNHQNGNIEDFYTRMYYNSQVDFARKDFYRDTNPVFFSSNNFRIQGVMDSSSTPVISVKIEQNM